MGVGASKQLDMEGIIMVYLQDVIEGVEKFVFFIGYPRSGHSIIGSMMDAHPDMVIAHEFMLFRKWQGQQALKSKGRLFNALYRRSLLDATEGSRTMDRDSKGYTLQMEQSWQGRFRKLKVIGDKSGGMVAKLYAENPEDVWRSYQEIVDTVKIPVRVLHVVRNPYDMIATQCLFNASGVLGHKANATANHPYNNSENIIYKIQRLYTHASGINRILHEWGLDVLEIHSADHVRDPKGTMQRICDFLELECPEDYLQQCYDKTFKTLSRSRDLVVWSPETRKMVEEGMREFPFLHRYSFEKDY